MIKDIIAYNEKVEINNKEISILKEAFPSCFNNEGLFDIDSFTEAIKDKANIINEGYELKFLGKRYAKLLRDTETTTVLQPNIEHNSKVENLNSQNVFISGDNLDALKHLLKSYRGKVKCIYIDPPYNTGTDGFLYNDKFDYTVDDLAQKLSISEIEAQKILNLTKRGSASDSAWLTFMYSRLHLAKNLLNKEGVIFISIDDYEQANLKLLCDDVFGIENFIEQIVWKRKATAPNDRVIGKIHEYILVYARSHNDLKIFLQDRDERLDKAYKNPDNDPNGPWSTSDLSANGKGGRLTKSCIYPIVNPLTGEEHYPPKNKCWIPNELDAKYMIKSGRIGFRENAGTPFLKRYLYEVRQGQTLSTLLLGEDDVITDGGFSSDSAKEIDELFGAPVFEFPKPTKLIKKLLTCGMADDDLVVDFFAGSSTTAHAVMELNSLRGCRHYILVQLDEPCKENSVASKLGYKTIDQVGFDRIIRAANKIKEKHVKDDVDFGFKHYFLVEPNQNTLDKMDKFDSEMLYSQSTVLDEFGIDTVLTTWLVHDGYGFSSLVKEVYFGGYKAFWCQKHLYMINSGFDDIALSALIDKLANDKEFSPENIILFGYSFTWTNSSILETNLKMIKDLDKALNLNMTIRY